jgi:dienelactone hydrolase
VSSGSRTPEQIRRDIEETRQELAYSMEDLRGKVAELTDWRKQLANNREVVLAGAAIAGFVIGGGIAVLRGWRRQR